MRQQTYCAKRFPLLDEKGRLYRSGWSTGDVFLYNKEELRRGARRKEWEFYRLFNRRFSLQLTWGHTGLVGEVRAVLIDLETGRSWQAGKKQRFPGDSLDTDFSGGEPHRLKYEDDGFFLSLDFDGTYRRIRCRAAAFDVELMCPEEGDAFATAAPFGKKKQFVSQYKKNYLDVRGRIKVGGSEYRIDEESFLFLRSCRGIWPRESSWFWGCGTARVGEHILGINLGWGAGRITNCTENVIFWDGEAQKLSRCRRRGDGDMGRSFQLEDEDGRLRLRFTPHYDHRTEKRSLLCRSDCRQLFGSVSGIVRLDDGSVQRLTDAPFCCEFVKNQW